MVGPSGGADSTIRYLPQISRSRQHGLSKPDSSRRARCGEFQPLRRTGIALAAAPATRVADFVYPAAIPTNSRYVPGDGRAVAAPSIRF